ncbi:MAG: hypothetical protein J2P25_17835 [Nocardiopsaceae bacterium]|nr:hypothetical protein [Nocardiopsaceae bacterium]
MTGDPRHPGIDELSEFRAGVTDEALGERVAAHLADCPGCTVLSERLAHVPAVLAAAPAPAIPGDVEARITSAIAAEAARRDLAAPPKAAGSSALKPTRPSGSRATGHRSLRRRPRVAASAGALAAAACLGLAFAGYQLSETSHPAASASAPNQPRSSASPRVAGPNSMHAGPRVPGPGQQAPSFSVTVTDTNFRKATLRSQVRRQLAAPRGASRAGNHGATTSPSRALAGCVMSITGGTKPRLVEQAAYQSRPAYVIAVPDHAWVVARTCTASDPGTLASVSLPPGG